MASEYLDAIALPKGTLFRFDESRGSMTAEELDTLERAGRARAWDEGETHALGRAIVALVAEVRRLLSERAETQ